MFERGTEVSYATCGLPYYVGGVIQERSQLLVGSVGWFRQVFRVTVCTQHEVEAIDRQRKVVRVRDLKTGSTREEPYDALVLAPGSSALIPPITGVESPLVFSLRTLEEAERLRRFLDERQPRSGTIIGAGYIGIEVAENLLRRGINVRLIEKLPQVLPQWDPEMVNPLREALLRRGVELHLGTEIAAIETATDGGLRLLDSQGREWTSDFVVLAAGIKPNVQLAADAGLEIGPLGGIRVDERMRTSDPNIWAVGDAVEVTDWVTGQATLVALAGPTARQARVAAENICGRPSRYRGAQATSIVAFFDLTLASTGATEKQLQRAGIPYRKSYSHSFHHATYYPGAERMAIKLLFAPDSGQILGAQIVGGQGVDRRIDVLALAIQQRATVFELEEAELAYAPQFGSTRDPINIAASVAANILREDVSPAYWEEWLQADPGARPLLVDVRSPQERAQAAVPDSLNIPLPELRSRLAELPKDREILVHCAVGQRGYYAARILKQLGYRVRNLAGGMITYRMLTQE
jgi:NADPH-dependent 2,4-dienoyl-CoA reductase/sulfur reductase-like enzyme/rhodanese-related sulfurtransferase